MTASTTVAADMQRHLQTVMGVNKMNNGNNAVATQTDTAAQPATAKAGPVSEIRDRMLIATASAGTPGFAADLAKLEEAVAKAKIKLELPTWQESAKHAAVIGGVSAAIMVGTVLVLKLIAGSGQGSSN